LIRHAFCVISHALVEGVRPKVIRTMISRSPALIHDVIEQVDPIYFTQSLTMSVQEQIEQLRKELHEHNYRYYVLSQPVISDVEFDQKLKTLEALEKAHPQYDDPNSPTHRVGSDLTKTFAKVTHAYPMLSLSNTYSETEINEFFDRAARLLNEPFEIVCELKFDGVSIALHYLNGKLERAVTRGDGTVGDDVTANVRTIRSIPLQLIGDDYPPQFEIRGEILLPWKAFDEINREREKEEEPLFANPRNAASGTIKLQNPKEVAKRQLDVYLYYLLGETLPYDGHYENLMKARSWGFKISDAIKKCHSMDEVFQFIHYWEHERHSLPFATDGIVLKINSLRQQELLGSTAKNPRWAVAFKYQAEQATTTLRSIDFQVGRTGVITPVANLAPVTLAGTVVKRATLHNADVMASFHLHEGDQVVIEKGGEIIPKIVSIAHSNNEKPEIQFIDKCPACGTPLVRIEGEAGFYCPNEAHCAPQIKGKIEHFIHRKAMNMDGIGSETVDLLFQKNLIHSIADLYTLQPSQLTGIERLGTKSIQNILNAVEKSKKVPFERVLFALGIRYVGEKVAKALAYAFKNIDALAEASEAELAAVNDIGVKIAQSVATYFSVPENQQLINQLKKAGLQFSIAENTNHEQKSDKLKGKIIVISGVFTHHTRDEYKQMIEQHGGKEVSSVSARTSFLLAGEDPGPAKIAKAKELSIPVMSENEFLKLIDLTSETPPTAQATLFD